MIHSLTPNESRSRNFLSFHHGYNLGRRIWTVRLSPGPVDVIGFHSLLMDANCYRRGLSASRREKSLFRLSSSRNCRTHGSISMDAEGSKTDKLSSERKGGVFQCSLKNSSSENVLSCCSKVRSEQEQHSICSFWALATMIFPICMAVNPRKAPAVKYPEAELSAPRRADLADVPRRALQRASLSFFLFSA